MQPSYWCKSPFCRNQDMRYIFIFISLLSFYVLPKKILAQSKTVASTESNHQGSKMTNKLIALIKRCQDFNRKIASNNMKKKSVIKPNPASNLMARKGNLSVVLKQKNHPKKTQNNRRITKSVRTSASAKPKKTSWSFLDLFSQFYGPAPFARR